MRMRLVRLIIAAGTGMCHRYSASRIVNRRQRNRAIGAYAARHGERRGLWDTVGRGQRMLNRVGNPAFADTLEGVLEQTGALTGDEYDVESLRAARELLSGTRTLPENVLYLKREDSGGCWSSDGFFKQLGSFQFFTNI